MSRERVLVWGGSRCYSRRKREKVLFVSETERVSALTVREREREKEVLHEGEKVHYHYYVIFPDDIILPRRQAC